MGLQTEVSFPRGGKKPLSSKKFTKPAFSLFGKKKVKKVKTKTVVKKKKKESNKKDETKSSLEVGSVSAETLSYKTLQEGMVVLGCVRGIQKTDVGILLPGRLTATASVTQISEPYTKMLHSLMHDDNTLQDYRPLNEIFRLGQCVACKVTEIAHAKDSDLHKVSVSLMPNLVQEELSHTRLDVGMVLTGAISSIEEHVYVVDVGIKNCRAFLPKNCDQELSLGQLIWCAIIDVKSSKTATTIKLSTDQDDITKTILAGDRTLHDLVPGMKTKFTVTNILGDGLEGNFLNDFIGYINESQLETPLTKPDKYQVGQTLEATVLYVMPTSKFTYFTLNSIKDRTYDKFQDGAVLQQAMVIARAGKGLYLRLSKHEKGYVSYQRVKKPKSGEFSEDVIAKAYPIGSKHRCRVLCYDYMDSMYICTLEKELVNEQFFSVDNVKCGQLVTVTIEDIKPIGLVVTLGRLSGLVPNLHTTDAPILMTSTVLKMKYKSGQKINVRVWDVDKKTNRVFFTLKSSLLNSKLPCLTCYEEVKEEEEQYEGVVVKISEKGLLIVFYGGVKGWAPYNQISADKDIKLNKMFYLGQVVKCRALRCSVLSKKLTLSLKAPKTISKKKNLPLGKHFNGTVINKSGIGLEVKIDGENCMALVPALHLTQHQQLANLLTETYSKNDLLSNLICVNTNYGLPVLSLRDSELFPNGILDYADLKPGDRIPCSLFKTFEHTVALNAPVRDFKRFFIVPLNEFCDNPPENLKSLDLQKFQPLWAQVLTIRKNKNEVNATTKLSKTCHDKLQAGLNYLSSYLLDIKRIRNFWEKENRPLANVKLGQRIKCTTDTNSESFCTVNLDSDLTGIVYKEHFSENLQENQEVDGVVLWIDFVQNSVILSLSKKLKNMVSEDQDVSKNSKLEGSHTKAVVLMISENFVITVLRGNGKGLLALIPVRCHCNDLIPNIAEYTIGDTIEVYIARIIDGVVIGLDWNKYKMENDKLESKNPKKRKATQNENEPKNKQRKISVDEEKVPKNDKMNSKKPKEVLEKTISESDQKKRKISIDEEKVAKNDKKNVKTPKEVVEKKQKREAENNTQNEISKHDQKKRKRQEVDEVVETSVKKKEKKEKVPKLVKSKINKDDKSEMKQQQTESCESSDDEDEKKIEEEFSLPGADNFWSLNLTNANTNEEVQSEDESDDEQTKLKKKKKLTAAEKAERAREKEKELRKTEDLLADENATPTSAEQFDRLVMSHPDSSLVWINYMAFHLQATEIEKARSVARKALSVISFREEQEKLNVWVALLNLENRYGTKDSFNSVLEEASRVNDDLAVHLKALDILAEGDKQAELFELVNKVVRKHKTSQAWLQAAAACFRCGLVEKARHLLQRALTSLPQKEHVGFIIQFAQLETKNGFSERAETLLDEVLASYPRRVDVWSLYVDMLVKANRIDVARNVLERAATLKIPARKMKTIFKKYIEFEQKYGSPEGVEKIQKMALDYVKKCTE